MNDDLNGDGRPDLSTGACCGISGLPIFINTSPGPVQPLKVERIFPDRGGKTGTVTARILGTGFQSAATVKLTGVGPDISGTNIVVSTSRTLITASFDLRGAPPGVRSLALTNLTGAPVSLFGGFTVEQGGASQIWVDVLGFDRLGVGRPQAYTVIYGNRGNLDANAAHIWISFPSALVWGVKVGPQPSMTAVLETGNTILGFTILPVPTGSAEAVVFTLQAPLTFTTPFQLSAWGSQP